jgi:serine/threonine protein kinase
MKLVCNYGNIVDTGNFWCNNCTRNCQAGQLSEIFDAGEQINEFTILARLKTLPTSSLYRVQHHRRTYLLKIAHHTSADLIKEESSLLSQMPDHPALPQLTSVVERRPYAKMSIHGKIRYYLLFKDIEGDFLRNYIERNYSFAPNIAALLVISLADVTAFLNVRMGKVVTNLSPDNVIVRKDKQGYFRPILIDLTSTVDVGKYPQGLPINVYQAPEVVSQSPCSATADVYSLGAMLYELLTGTRIFPDKLKLDSEIKSMILHQEPVSLSERRKELQIGISDLIQLALSKKPTQRQPDVRTFAKSLRVIFGEVPAEQRKFYLDRKVVALVVFAIISVLLTLILALLFRA